MFGASRGASLRYMDGGYAVLANVCPVCGKTHESPVFPLWRWDAWLDARRAGAHVRSFWPELTPGQREEFFISGICGGCRPKMETGGRDCA